MRGAAGTFWPGAAALAALLGGCSSYSEEGVPEEPDTPPPPRVYHSPGPAPDYPEIVLFGVTREGGALILPAYVAAVTAGGTAPVARQDDAIMIAEHSITLMPTVGDGTSSFVLDAGTLDASLDDPVFQVFRRLVGGTYYPVYITSEVVKSGEGDALYSYVSLADFSSGGSAVLEVFGEETPDPGRPWYVLPFGWDATYSGHWSGDVGRRSASGLSWTGGVGGTAELTLDFGSQSITGTLTPVAAPSDLSLGPVTLTGTIENSILLSGNVSGSLRGAAVYGEFSGALYGPDADEAGGVFYAYEWDFFGSYPESPLEQLIGGFVAQR